MGEVILVASGKGGTGKTVFSANLGALFAIKGYKTIVLDMDMGTRNLDIYLGLESRIVFNIMDVFKGVCGVKKAQIKHRGISNLFMMAASPKKDDIGITALHIKTLCDELKKEFDYIIIDAPTGMGNIVEVAASVANKGIIVTEPEFASIRDADGMERFLKNRGVEQRAYVLNKVRVDLMSSGLVPTLSQIGDLLRIPMIGAIQYDENIYVSTNRGIPIVCKESTYIRKNFAKISARIQDRIINNTFPRG
ncbi:MAG: septum site-determining protein MinD [Anaerovoracaceae bacterium]